MPVVDTKPDNVPFSYLSDGTLASRRVWASVTIGGMGFWYASIWSPRFEKRGLILSLSVGEALGELEAAEGGISFLRRRWAWS